MGNQVAARDNAKYEYYGALDMELVECCNCGILFGVTDQFKKQRRRKHDTFYCPHGHPLSYSGESDEERLKRQLASAREDVRVARADTEVERRSHAATKSQLTKTKKRVVAGVCPCCNRTFQQLSRRMAGQHPEYQP